MFGGHEIAVGDVDLPVSGSHADIVTQDVTLRAGDVVLIVFNGRWSTSGTGGNRGDVRLRIDQPSSGTITTQANGIKDFDAVPVNGIGQTCGMMHIFVAVDTGVHTIAAEHQVSGATVRWAQPGLFILGDFTGFA